MVFSGSSTTGAPRFLETKSIGIGPSYMMQFNLIIGCGGEDSEEPDSTVCVVITLIEWIINQIRPML